jgi:hypothetical protein
MRICILALTIGLMSATPSFARIGDNIDECKSRYGMWSSFHPITEKRVKVLFSTKLMDVEVIFYEGLCESISYTRHDGVHDPYYFSEEEIDVLLNVNCEGMEWVKDKSNVFDSLIKKWHTSDKTHYAARQCARKGTLFREGEPVNDTSFCELSIMTAKAIEHAAEEHMQKIKKANQEKVDEAKDILKGY